MADNLLSASIIAKEALAQLDNNLVMSKLVHRAYEDEYAKSVNGYTPGTTISIRRPAQFTVRTGATASNQDVVEGTTAITIDQQVGVDFNFTSQQLTLNIKDLSERVIKPAMIQLANKVDRDLMALYSKVPNWVGTPGAAVNTYAKFQEAAKRMDLLAVPDDMRRAVMTTSDFRDLASAQAGIYVQKIAETAIRASTLGVLGGVDTYSTQNTPTHTVGVATGTPKVNGASQNVTYDSVKDTYVQDLVTDGWTNSTTGILKAGDVFTIAGVYAVNPVTKVTTSKLRQFVVQADVDSGASTGPATISISPPIIISGSQKTCSAAPADNADITVVGTGATAYDQNLVFHKNAFALCMVPLVMPPGSIGGARQSYKGLSVRVVPYYDGTNDISSYRLDVLYGVKAIDPRLAVRLNG